MSADQEWRRPPDAYRLPGGEVHVWRAALAQPAEALLALAAALSPDERARAARYRREDDRRRSVIGHGLLRQLLGQCLGEAPGELRFELGEFGKPALAGPGTANRAGPHFNISHAGDWILIGLAADRPIGVDVERMREEVACDRLAERFFSRPEREALASLPPALRRAAFFACWTRKEAYLKARGDGLTLALDRFDVSLMPGAEPRLLATRHDPADAGRWRMAELDVGPDHAGAVVAPGPDWSLRRWHWQHAACA